MVVTQNTEPQSPRIKAVEVLRIRDLLEKLCKRFLQVEFEDVEEWVSLCQESQEQLADLVTQNAIDPSLGNIIKRCFGPTMENGRIVVYGTPYGVFERLVGYYRWELTPMHEDGPRVLAMMPGELAACFNSSLKPIFAHTYGFDDYDEEDTELDALTWQDKRTRYATAIQQIIKSIETEPEKKLPTSKIKKKLTPSNMEKQLVILRLFAGPVTTKDDLLDRAQVELLRTFPDAKRPDDSFVDELVKKANELLPGKSDSKQAWKKMIDLRNRVTRNQWREIVVGIVGSVCPKLAGNFSLDDRSEWS